MRALALRTTVATMVTAGLLLGGAGIASATGSSSSATTTTTSTTPSPTTTTPTTTTPTTTTSTSTSPTTTTSTSTSTSTSTATTSPTAGGSTPTTTTSGPKGTATAVRGCVGETSVTITGTQLAEGLPVEVQIVTQTGTGSIPAEVVDGAITVVVAKNLVGTADHFELGVIVGDQAFGHYTVAVPASTDVCTAHATISLARDCTSPDTVLANVSVTGLSAGLYGVGVVGTAPDGSLVQLTSENVRVTGTGFAGTLPLLPVDSTVPLSGFTGIALVIEGKTLASVAGADVSLATCVAPAPLPVAPAQPVVVTTPAAAAPAQPAALAQTGSPAASLALLGVLLLGLGGLTTLLARRAAR